MKNKCIFVACDTSNLEKVNTPEKKTIHFKMSKDLFKKLNNNEE